MNKEKKVTFIPATVETLLSEKYSKLRVAAYCRVSTDSEEQSTSYEAQIDHYTSLILKNPDWVLAGIYADEASGTSVNKRSQFNKMIKKCKSGEIDLILVKSVSRFARNTLDCIQYTRMLRAMNIGVIFEKEGINSLEAKDEMILSILGTLAQAESESMSRNIRLGKQYRYKQGKVPFVRILGYRKGENGRWEIIPEEAKIIERIYNRYLDGLSLEAIKKELEKDNIPSLKGIPKWNANHIQNILKNERYIGDALLQKTYVSDVLSKKVKRNTGELPMYYVTDNHAAIISRELYSEVQVEISRRQWIPSSSPSKKPSRSKYSSKYALTEIMHCGYCGTPYKRVTWSRNGKKKIVWRCRSRLENGTKYCKKSPTVVESQLHDEITHALNSVISKELLMEALLESVSTISPTSRDQKGQNQQKIVRQVLIENFEKSPPEFSEYGDYYTRQLISEIKVLSNKLSIQFKDGITIERSV